MRVRARAVGSAWSISQVKCTPKHSANGGRMVTVHIRGQSRSDDDISPAWINEQLARRGRDESTTCVRVDIEPPSGNRLYLQTPGCTSGGGGGFAPPFTNQQRRIIDLWNERGLNKPDFTAGSLIAFLKQLRQVI